MVVCSVCGLRGSRCPAALVPRPLEPVTRSDTMLHCGYEFNLSCKALQTLRGYVAAGTLGAATFEDIVCENQVPGAFMFAVHFHTTSTAADMRAWYAKEAAKTAPVLGRVKGLYLKCVSAKRHTTTVLMQVFPSCIPRPQYVIISDGLKRSRIAARRSAYDKDDDPDMHHDFEPFSVTLIPYRVLAS